MKQSDNYCDYITRLDLKQVGFTQEGERSELSKDDTYLPNPTWLEALEWLEGKGFMFDLMKNSNRSSANQVCHYSKMGFEIFYNGSILSAIQTAVKEAVKIKETVKILKEQSK